MVAAVYVYIMYHNVCIVLIGFWISIHKYNLMYKYDVNNYRL